MTTTAVREPALTTPQSHLDLFGVHEKTLTGHDRSSVVRRRRAAIARFGELGFPGPRDEDWKFTSVGPIVRTPMLLPDPDSAGAIHFKGVSALPEGVIVCTLAEAMKRCPERVEAHLARYAPVDNHPFVALNTAFWNHGAFIFVPPGVVVEEPIEVTYPVLSLQENAPGLWYRRCLIVLEKAAQATVVEQFAGIATPYMTNAVCEVVLEEDARLDHYKVQEESPQAFHLACTQVVQARGSNFSTHFISLGGQLVRNEVRVLFTGQHAEATVNGLYQSSGTQHVDNMTVIDHAQPNCDSHELYKGVLDGKSKGVFNGKIFVRPDAQKTDAKQTNKTLLLSDEATINTKPQLEIFADDVKCTHGATVGQLDEQQLFYLRSRGIGPEQARALLTFAFANDIISRVKVAGLRQRLEGVLLEASHLPRLAETEDEQ